MTAQILAFPYNPVDRATRRAHRFRALEIHRGQVVRIDCPGSPHHGIEGCVHHVDHERPRPWRVWLADNRCEWFARDALRLVGRNPCDGRGPGHDGDAA